MSQQIVVVRALQWRHNDHNERLDSPASRLFTQPFIQTQIKENIKAPCHWPLCGEFTGEFPAKTASNTENVSIWWRHHEMTYSVGKFTSDPYMLWSDVTKPLPKPTLSYPKSVLSHSHDMRTISVKILIISICETNLKMTFLKLLPYFQMS